MLAQITSLLEQARAYKNIMNDEMKAKECIFEAKKLLKRYVASKNDVTKTIVSKR